MTETEAWTEARRWEQRLDEALAQLDAAVWQRDRLATLLEAVLRTHIETERGREAGEQARAALAELARKLTS